MICPVCGTRRNRAHLFCPGCGSRFNAPVAADAPVSTPAPSRARRSAREVKKLGGQAQRLQERKYISVLFADLCGSTEQISSFDPEEAQIYLDRVLTLMSQSVETYDGTVSQLLGDGLLALFGAPVAQEDHALRACLAAVEMQRRARESTASGRALTLRIGINSGEVIVGTVSHFFASHYRADGSTIYLAARLEQLARPGTVLLGGATVRLVGEQVETCSLGARAIRGLRGEVEVYELVTSGQRSAAAPLARRRQMNPMVGRAETLARLHVTVQQVLAGRMRALALRGEPGIGKSRLLVEFCNELKRDGFVIHCVAAHSYTSHISYGVISELVRVLLGVPLEMDLHPQREAARAIVAGWREDNRFYRAAVADMLEFGESDPEWLALTPSQRRRHIADLVFWLITRQLSSGLLVLAVEDIFLADRDSERLIESLVRRLENMPVLFCFTYRQDFSHRWMDASWLVEHTIGPLAVTDMCALAHGMLGTHESLAQVIDVLVERADGNPFFLEQLAITLIDNGTLVGAPHAYVCASPNARLSVPASIAALISARIDRLPAAAKASLEAAAVLGEPASSALIAAMRNIAPAEADNHLMLAVSSGLLAAPASTEQPRYRFRHGLVQEVVAGALIRPRRKTLHRAAFFALKEHHADQSVERSALLVHHAYNGEAWADAAKLALTSMTRSIARSANRDAMRVFQLGIDAARRLDPDPAALPLELGLCTESLGALLPLGETDACIANLTRAETITKRLGDVRRQAAVALQLAVIRWTQGRYRLGLEAANSAAKAAEKAGSRSVQMAARQARMMINHGLGRYGEVAEEGQAVIQIFGTELGVLQVMHGWAVIAAINVKTFLADALWRMSEIDAAQRICDEAYDELSRQEHNFSRVLVDFVQGEIWIAQERYEDAANLFKSALASCATHDMPTMYPVFTAALGGAMARAGHAAEAVALLEKGIADKLYLAGGRYNDYYFPMNLAIALAEAGRYAEAMDSAAAALAAASAYEQGGHQTHALFELAEIEVSAGRPDLALTHYRETVTMAAKCSMSLVKQRALARIEQVNDSLRLLDDLQRRGGALGMRDG